MAIPPAPTQSVLNKKHTLKRVASNGLSDSETTQQTTDSPQLMARMTRNRASALDARRRRRKKRKLSVTKDSPNSLTTPVAGPSSPGSSGSQKGKEREIVVQSIEVEEPSGLDQELAELREKVKQQALVLDQHKAFLDALSPSLTCQICLDPMHRPYALAPCGHTACYTCLLAWFRAPPAHIVLPPPQHLSQNFDPQEPALLARGAPMLLRKEKTCPHCRAVVREAPVEAWAVKDTVSHLYSRFGVLAKQLYPSHERPADDPPASGVGDEVWNGVFKALLRPRIAGAANAGTGAAGSEADGGEGARGFWDEEDEVYRCTQCMHEIFDGLCSSCGHIYPGHLNGGVDDEWLTEDEVEGGLWMDHGPDGSWRDEDDGEEDYDGSDAGLNDVNALQSLFGLHAHILGGPPRGAEDGYESSFIDDDDEEGGGHDDGVSHHDDEYHSAEDDQDSHGEIMGDDVRWRETARLLEARRRLRMPGALDLGSDEDEHESEHDRDDEIVPNQPLHALFERHVGRLSDSEEDEGAFHPHGAENDSHVSAAENDSGEDEDETPHWSRRLVPRLQARFGTLLSDSEDGTSGSENGSFGTADPLRRSSSRQFVCDRGHVHASREGLTDSEEGDEGSFRPVSRGSPSNGSHMSVFHGFSDHADASDDEGTNAGEDSYFRERMLSNQGSVFDGQFEPYAEHGSDSEGGSHYGDAFSEDEMYI